VLPFFCQFILGLDSDASLVTFHVSRITACLPPEFLKSLVFQLFWLCMSYDTGPCDVCQLTLKQCPSYHAAYSEVAALKCRLS